MKRAKDYWNYILEDDNKTPYGGTAFSDETLGDFIEEIRNYNEKTPMHRVNKALKECGIKTIKYGRYDRKTNIRNTKRKQYFSRRKRWCLYC